MTELVIRFQWVKCQLDALGRCLSLSSLRKALRSLPKDLDDTYARILQSVEDDEHSKLVATIVQWLAYSYWPMSLADFSEALTVDPDDEHQFDVGRRLENPQDILKICSSLVTTEPGLDEDGTSPGTDEILQFAHLSVCEYLESSRIHDGPAKRYAIQKLHSNTIIAESCIIYLHHLDVPQKHSENEYFEVLGEEYPLAKYAIFNWGDHAERAEEGGNIIALSKAFLREAYRLPRWEVPGSWYSPCFDLQGVYLPLLYASSYNIPKITSALILEGADVNASNRSGWTPLMGMLMYHHERMDLVQLLLKHGADVNARNADGDTAVIIAASNGKVQTVRILLDNAADMDAVSRKGNTALTEAAKHGHLKVVRFLLDRGVSVRHPLGSEALKWASSYDDPEMVGMLLDRGAGVDAELYVTRTSKCMHASGFRAAALFGSLQCGKKELAKFLLKYGADVNTPFTVGEKHGVAFQHALNYGQDFVLEFLLEHGADPSLVAPEHLNKNGMSLYKERLLQFESQNESSRVQEGETDEAVADA